MLIQEAYQCHEVRDYSGTQGDVHRTAKETIRELQIVAHPRLRAQLGKLAEQIDNANDDELVTILQQAMGLGCLLTRAHPQAIADIYARHWT